MLEYLAALVLLGHGLGHTMGLAASWSKIETGLNDRPWILGGDVRIDSTAGRAFGLVFLLATVLFVAASVLALTGSEQWRAFALFGAVSSVACVVPWWHAMIWGPRLGVLLDIVIILVLLVPGGEALVDFFGLP